MPLNFFKPKIPKRLPRDMYWTVRFVKEGRDKKEALMRAYVALTRKYRGYSLPTYLYFWRLFQGVDSLWKQEGFLHCNNFNYLLRVILIKSGKFNDEDIRHKWTLLYGFSPHQYSKIRIGDEWIDIDMWGKSSNIHFGHHTTGFGNESKRR